MKSGMDTIMRYGNIDRIVQKTFRMLREVGFLHYLCIRQATLGNR